MFPRAEVPARSPPNSASHSNRFFMNPDELPIYKNHIESISSAYVQMSKVIEPTVSTFGRFYLRLQPTQKFLIGLQALLSTITGYGNVRFPQRSGFECGFVSGSLLALQTDERIKLKLTQNLLQDSFTLIILQILPLKHVQQESAPIIIDFDHSSSKVPNSDGDGIRVRDIAFMSDQAIYTFIEPNFEYSIGSTVSSEIMKPKPLAQHIISQIRSGLAAGPGSEFLDTISKYIVDEFEHINTPNMMFPVAKHCLKSYLTGALSAESRPGHVQVQVLEPVDLSSMFNLAFLITDFLDGLRVCLNVIENLISPTVQVEKLQLFGQLLPTTRLLSLKLQSDQMLVLNVFQSPRHKTQVGQPPSQRQDYMFYKVEYGTVTINNPVFQSLFHQTFLPSLQIVPEVQAIINGRQQHDLGRLLQKLHSVVFVHKAIVTGGDAPTNLVEFVRGLLHYERKRVSLIRHGVDDHGVLFTFTYKNWMSETEHYLSIVFKTGRSTLSFDQQRFDVPQHIHKVFIVNYLSKFFRYFHNEP